MKTEMRITSSQIPRLRREVPARAERIVEGTARHIEGEAKRRIVAYHAVATGFLLNSVVADEETATRWLVTVGAAYGAFVNFGTRYMAPRPYFTEAAAEGRRYLRRELAGIFR